MEIHKRYAISSSASGLVTATIDIPTGAWSIETAAVHVGGSEVIVRAIPTPIAGRIVVEQQDEQTTSDLDYGRSDKLVVGVGSFHHPIIMQSPKIVKGPCRIKSLIHHAQGHEHVLSVTYRRVYP